MMYTVFSFLLTILIVFMPFLNINLGGAMKVFPTDIIICLLFLCYFSLGLRREISRKEYFNLISLTGLVLILLLGFSFLVTEDATNNLKRILYYFEYFVLIPSFFLFYLKKEPNYINLMLKILIILGMLIALYGVLQWLFNWGPDHYKIYQHMRAFGTLGQPNSFAAFLAQIIPFPLVFLIDNQNDLKKKILYYSAFVIIIGGIFVSFSRGAIISTLLVTFFILLGCFFSNQKKRLICVTIFISIIISYFGINYLSNISFYPINQITENEKNDKVTKTIKNELSINQKSIIDQRIISINENDHNVNHRIKFWQTAYEQILESPLLGKGSFKKRLLNKFPDIIEIPPHAHNLYLQIGVASGLLGIFTILIFQVSLIIRAYQNLRREYNLIMLASLASMLIFMSHNLVDFLMFRGVSMLFIINAVLILFYSSMETKYEYKSIGNNSHF